MQFSEKSYASSTLRTVGTISSSLFFPLSKGSGSTSIVSGGTTVVELLEVEVGSSVCVGLTFLLELLKVFLLVFGDAERPRCLELLLLGVMLKREKEFFFFLNFFFFFYFSP